MSAHKTGKLRRLPRRLALFVVLLAVTASALAAQFRVSDIRVEGLQRIAAGTVFNYLPVQVGDTTTDDITASIIRTLYGTGFFKDVRVERDGTVLVVWVQERPAVAEINISGNKDMKTEDLKTGLKDIGLAEGRTFDPLGSGSDRAGAQAPILRGWKVRRGSPDPLFHRWSETVSPSPSPSPRV